MTSDLKASAPPMDPDLLLDLDDEAFTDIVDQHVRNRQPTPALLDPVVIERYFSVLTRLKAKTELTMAAKAAEVKGDGWRDDDVMKLEKWKAGALRFKTSIEEAIIDTRWRLMESQRERLYAAIEKHRAGIDPDDTTEQDRELWSTLDS